MPSVIVRENETFERALKRFNKACEKSGLMREIRKRQFYEKPSQERKRLRNAARRKQQKMMLMEKQNQIY